MRSPLDGPGMGYGPGAGADRRGVPLVTIVLALACLLLAVTLAAVLLRPSGQAADPAAATSAPSPASAPAPTPGGATPTPAAPTVTGSATPSTSVTPSGTDATLRAEEPPGVREAATAFLRGWREPRPEVRLPLLRAAATESLTEQLSDIDPAKIPRAKPVGAVVVSSASDYAAAADQKMSDRTTVRMELVYDPSSQHGWLVDAIEPVG